MSLYLDNAATTKISASIPLRYSTDSGVFIFSITHPCYWPIYWNYYKEDWFDYNKELNIHLKIYNLDHFY